MLSAAEVKTRARLTPEEYADAFRRNEVEVATERGCYVFYSTPNMLQLDLDSKEDLEFAQVQVERLSLEGIIAHIRTDILKSRNDRYHMIVWVWNSMDVDERIMYQALLGSDRTREALNLMRYHKGVSDPIRLFRPLGTEPPKPPHVLGPDDLHS